MLRRVSGTARGSAEVEEDRPRLRRALIALCVTEITSWGVLYYAFPVMLSALTADTGWSTASVMGAFSVGAVVSAIAGVGVGRLIDRRGPRAVMTVGAALGVAATLAVAAAPSLPWFFAAWVLAGLAQSALLYPPAFAALTGWYGPGRVRALTTLTLVAGLSSTVFAPLVAALLEHLDWRTVYLLLAAVLAVVVLPLHVLCLTPPWPHSRSAGRRLRLPYTRQVVTSRAFVVLSVAMALAGFGMFAATLNLVPLLTSRGIGNQLAAVALGLCGAGQVLGRLGYAPLAHRTSPPARTAGIVTVGAFSVAALGLLPGPPVALIALAVLAGMIRGSYTLLLATAVADRWGTTAFGQINGVFTAPTTALTALAPGGGALIVDVSAGYATGYLLLALLTLTAATAALATRAGPAPALARRG
jgi:MFS family permease